MKLVSIIITILIISALIAAGLFLYKRRALSLMVPLMIPTHITSVDDLKKLVMHNAADIPKQVELALNDAQKRIDTILAIPTEERTFENTALPLDRLAGLSPMEILMSVLWLLKETNPNEPVRDAADAGIKRIEEFFIDNISNNRTLYNAFKSYVEGNAQKEQLDDEQKYFIEQTMQQFKRAGLHLPDDQLAKVNKLHKELADLSLVFSKNIACDQSTITVTKEGLEGLDDDFIKQLKQTDDGLYILGVDYPTYIPAMENSAVEDTRKRLYHAFQNRAYPANKEVLQQIIQKRNELAQLLGFKSYTEFDLAEQMVKTPERAHSFLDNLLKKSQSKEKQEIEMLSKDLPESVSFTEDGKLKPWDYAYLKNEYKKKHLEIDERKIAEYFPMQNTIDGLLNIYQTFFNLSFEQVPSSGWWDKDVKLIKVFDQANNNKFLGYLFLDLHPRPFKYSHACQIGLIHTIKENGTQTPAVVAVLANFPKPTAEKPSLLTRSDARTFFHEFGHALHTLLGTTQMATFSGTNVKRDFVEMPSQMLEEWLWDPAILKQVSSHYKTGEPLPDELIKKIVNLKTFDTGNFVQGQSIYSLLSLSAFDEKQHDLDQLMKKLHTTYRPHYFFPDDNHMYASFGHLTGYGAKYYGYLWSHVFAVDLFEKIKKHGLLNPEIGALYVKEVIGKGGSKDPNELLSAFLGRAPKIDAFLKDMGIEK